MELNGGEQTAESGRRGGKPERICGGSAATGERGGSSINGMMMMQAHVKS